MKFEKLLSQAENLFQGLLDSLTSPAFYTQCAIIIASTIIGLALGKFIINRIPFFNTQPADTTGIGFKKWLYRCKNIISPLCLALTLGIAINISLSLLEQNWLVRIAQSIAVLFLLYALIKQFIASQFLRSFFKWTILPLSMLHIFGLLTPAVNYLDTVHVNLGNIQFSAYAVLRTIFFGFLLFWLGRFSSNTGQQFIRSQEDLDIGTREVFAKLFEIFVLVLIFFVLLQIMGINLTTLAVFGGAIGVGLGFGLQAIASNFISGIILLLDRSLLVGDYIELEDGRQGTIRKLSMRSATLETYDGKDIVVPNEKFITSSFTNWTHKNKKQRYSLSFQVAYKTDLHALFPVLKKAIANHPQVLSGADILAEEQPDVEIDGFGDSGVDILVEYWMEGIDDGVNRVDADLKLIIWDILKEHMIEIPFPQREIKILDTSA